MTAPGASSSPCGRKAPAGRILSLLLALAVLLSGASPTLAAAPQTSIHDVEDEVMCPICGTLLELAESPQAQRERALVKRLIAAGKTKAEVKDILVAQYGPAVLALPGGSGFDLSAYLVPAIAFAAAVVALALGVRRWRRAGGDSGPGGSAASGGPQGEDAERLEADLARYDL
jgi:cytochrome c-type biogenesis protein CcmH/NrfF